MDGMTGDHMHGMGPPAPNTTATMGGGMQMGHPHKMMMHMTFFWGKNTEILFPGWPGTSSGMYVLALIFVFVLSVVVEWLSHASIGRDGSNRVATGLIRTLVHLIRVGLAYMVMLAVMSFNVGVFLVAVFGHALGYLVFCSGIFGNSSASSTDADRKTTSHHVSGMGC